jgi:cell division transport system permease protein
VISRVTYVVREMWASLSRNVTLTIAAIITATVSLMLFGLTLLIQRAFENQLQRWTGGVEMIVYMENKADAESVALVSEQLQEQPTVESVTFCDIECTLDVAQDLFAGSPETLRQLTADNITPYFSVVPNSKDDAELLRQLRDRWIGYPGVRSVEFPQDQIDILAKLKGIVGVRTWVMSLALLFASALLIWNTIRTAIFARRREIEVMKLVGATNWFIRLPFMLEGLLQGLVGAGVASIIMWILNDNWTSAVAGFPFEAGLSSFVVPSAPWDVVAILLLVGAGVGAVGSATATTKFLDV